jgi:serine/threonine protein kinase
MGTYEGPTPLSLVLVQELIEGLTLQQRLDRAQPLSPREAEGVLRELLGALRYLHDREPPLVHRDVKPGNVILCRDDHPYLVDFGAIQTRLRGADSVGSTIVGTLGYMPLEQVRGQAVPASDLYALGMTMLVALTGQAPEQLPVDDATGKVAIDRVVPSGTSAALRGALDAMIEVLPSHRARSATDVLSRLDAPARRAPAEPEPDVTSSSTPARAPTPAVDVAAPEGASRRHARRHARRRSHAFSEEDLARARALPPQSADAAYWRELVKAPFIIAGMVAGSIAIAALAVWVSGSGTSHHASPSSTATSRPSDGRDTLLGKTLTNKLQPIPVTSAPPDLRFVSFPPPDWVGWLAAAWQPDAKLAGFGALQIAADGQVDLGNKSVVDYEYVSESCYSGFSSGARTRGTLAIEVDAMNGRLRVRASESPNTADRPLGNVCPLSQAFAAMANAGRLPAGMAYDVRNYDPPVAARWEFSPDHFTQIAGIVDVATCALVK